MSRLRFSIRTLLILTLVVAAWLVIPDIGKWRIERMIRGGDYSALRIINPAADESVNVKIHRLPTDFLDYLTLHRRIIVHAEITIVGTPTVNGRPGYRWARQISEKLNILYFWVQSTEWAWPDSTE